MIKSIFKVLLVLSAFFASLTNAHHSAVVFDVSKNIEITGKTTRFTLRNPHLILNIEVANEYGVKYITQPGGSIRDNEVIEECNKNNMLMLNTGIRLITH